MEATPELLLGMMAFLLLLTLSLVAFLVRVFRKGRSDKAQRVPSLESAPKKGESLSGNGTAEHVPAAVRALEDSEIPAVAPVTASERIPRPLEASRGTFPFVAAPADQTPHHRTEPEADLMLQVWQDREGFLLVEAGGQRYRRLFEIQNGDIGRHVLETINRLVAFSKGQESRVALTSAPSAVSSIPSSSTDEISQEFFDRLKQEAQVQPKISRISADPVPFRRQNPAREVAITLNLAEEIDQLLQLRVNTSPDQSHRRIRVTNAPDGGLRFEVDGSVFNALDDIPEPKVQTLIRAAISDWEARR